MTPQEELTALEAEYDKNNYDNHRHPEFMGEVEAARWYDARDALQARIDYLRNRIRYGEITGGH